MSYNNQKSESPIKRLQDALQTSTTLSHLQAQAGLPRLAQAEVNGDDVDNDATFAEVLQHLDSCEECTEVYAELVADLRAFRNESLDHAKIAATPPTFFGKPQRNEQFYFLNGPQAHPNQAMVRSLTEQIIQTLRPKELDISLMLFPQLLDRAAHQRPMQATGGGPFGFGGSDIMAFVVVPIMVDVLTGWWAQQDLDGVNSPRSISVQPPQITLAMVSQRAKMLGVQLKSKEITKLTNIINTMFQKSVDQP